MKDREILIELKNIKRQYQTGDVVTEVLKGINLKIHKGEFLSIIGPSGSGKSTLMHILGLLDTPSSGDYFFNGQNVKDLSDDQRADFRNDKIGFIFQTYYLLKRTSVFDNVKMPLYYSKVPIKKRDEMVYYAIESVNLNHRIGNSPSQLSGGEQQRAAIARAIVNEPDLILADEPTGNLDSKNGQNIMAILDKLNEQGHTIVMVTHERYTAEFAERIIRLKDGEIVEEIMVDQRHKAIDGELLK